MNILSIGTHEFTTAKFAELVQQYDQFMIECSGSNSLMQIRVPSKWVKLGEKSDGSLYLTCRNKRKRDGHLFEIYGSKFIFNVARNDDRLSGQFKSDLDDVDYYVAMWKTPNKSSDDDK